MIGIGDRAQFTKTITETDIAAFAKLSGDSNYLHLEDGMVHGLLTSSLISTVLGTMLPGPGTIYISQTLRFLAPVYAGQTVTANVVVTGTKPSKRHVMLKTSCENEEGRQVIDGEAWVLAPEREFQ